MSTTPEDPFARTSDASMAPTSAPAPQYAAPAQLPPAAPGQMYAQPPQPYYGHPAYAQPYGGPNPAQAKNWMNIVALVASLSTFFTLVGCIAGIIFGHLGLAAANKGEADNRGLGLAGLITGYVFLGIGILGAVGYFIFMAAMVAALGSAATID